MSIVLKSVSRFWIVCLFCAALASGGCATMSPNASPTEVADYLSRRTAEIQILSTGAASAALVTVDEDEQYEVARMLHTTASTVNAIFVEENIDFASIRAIVVAEVSRENQAYGPLAGSLFDTVEILVLNAIHNDLAGLDEHARLRATRSFVLAVTTGVIAASQPYLDE